MCPSSILPGGSRRGFLAGARDVPRLPASSDRFLPRWDCLRLAGRTNPWFSGGFQA